MVKSSVGLLNIEAGKTVNHCKSPKNFVGLLKEDQHTWSVFTGTHECVCVCVEGLGQAVIPSLDCSHRQCHRLRVVCKRQLPLHTCGEYHKLPNSHGIWPPVISSVEDSEVQSPINSNLCGMTCKGVGYSATQWYSLRYKKSSSFTSVQDLCAYAGCVFRIKMQHRLQQTVFQHLVIIPKADLSLLLRHRSICWLLVYLHLSFSLTAEAAPRCVWQIKLKGFFEALMR